MRLQVFGTRLLSRVARCATQLTTEATVTITMPSMIVSWKSLPENSKVKPMAPKSKLPMTSLTVPFESSIAFSIVEALSPGAPAAVRIATVSIFLRSPIRCLHGLRKFRVSVNRKRRIGLSREKNKELKFGSN